MRGVWSSLHCTYLILNKGYITVEGFYLFFSFTGFFYKDNFYWLIGGTHNLSNIYWVPTVYQMERGHLHMTHACGLRPEHHNTGHLIPLWSPFPSITWSTKNPLYTGKFLREGESHRSGKWTLMSLTVPPRWHRATFHSMFTDIMSLN